LSKEKSDLQQKVKDLEQLLVDTEKYYSIFISFLLFSWWNWEIEPRAP